MGYEIIRGPFMLPETVAMLYKFVNGITFQSVINRQRFFLDSAASAVQARKMKRLQEIQDEVCADLDPNHPTLRHYFARPDGEREYMCLAQLMVYSFCTLKEPDFRRNVEEICELWQDLQRRGYWISPRDVASLAFTNGPGCPGDLFRQVSALPFTGDLLMKIYGAFREFEDSLWEMARFIEPLAVRLEELFQKDTWLFEETENYWREVFQKKTPLDFVAGFAGKSFIEGAGRRTVVAVSLMNSHLLTIEMAGNSPMGLDYNLVYIGGAIPSNGFSRQKGGDLEMIGAMLKSLGDKKRLEILQRLSKNPSYGLELAEIMGVDSGNMSRTLAQLHSYGFLREEKDRLRVYYQTDREVIHNFLELVETTIFS